MIVHAPLLLFLLAHTAPADAALWPRAPADSLSRAARHVHRHVIKRSTGLLQDMRLAYAGLRLQQQPQVLESSKLYCTNSGGTSLTGSSNSTADDGSGSASSSALPRSSSSSSSSATSVSSASSASRSSHSTTAGSSGSSTSTSSSAGSTQSASPWKIAQTYVSALRSLPWITDIQPRGLKNRKATRSLTGGRSRILSTTRRTALCNMSTRTLP